MTAVVVRPVQPSEAAAIACLLNAHAHALYGEADVTDGLVAEWIDSDDIDMRVAVRGSEIVCYGDVMISPDGSRGDLDVREHPEHPGSGATMVAALEHLARDRRVGAVRAFADFRETVLLEALADRGYNPIRHSHRMEIALHDDLVEPVWPAGISPGSMAEGEERPVFEAHQESFRDHWGFEEHPYERWREEMIETERFVRELSFVARSDTSIAGVCLCALHSSGDPSHGWIRVLGVLPEWRRRGIASALLEHAFLELWRRGCTRAGLGVDAESTTGALELYERAGMHVHSRLDILEKPLG